MAVLVAVHETSIILCAKEVTSTLERYSRISVSTRDRDLILWSKEVISTLEGIGPH